MNLNLEVGMGRRGGRPRHIMVEREPNGRRRRPSGQTMSPAEWQRTRQFIAKFAKCVEAGSEIGRLNMFEGELTDAQAATAFRIGEIIRNFHRYNDLRDFPKSPSYESGFGSSGLDEERMTLDQIKAFEARAKKAKDEWEKVDKVLSNYMVYPPNLREAIVELCAYDHPVNSLLYPDIRLFLDQMARRWQGRPQETTERRLRIPTRQPRLQSPQVPIHPRPLSEPVATALEKVVSKLRPDLDEKGRRLVLETYQALKDREDHRRRKRVS